MLTAVVVGAVLALIMAILVKRWVFSDYDDE